MKLSYLALGLVVALVVTGCVQKAKQEAVDSAVETEQSEEVSDIPEGLLTAPANMPAELMPAEARISVATEVADGYQVGFSQASNPDSIVELYKGLSGWTVVAEFATEETRSLSLEREDQRVLINITPDDSENTTVLITGSFVKE